MQKNGIYLPDTLWKQIVGNCGWEGSFEQLANTIGRPGLCPTSNKKEWWYTGGIRTRFLGKRGEFSEETIVYDGQTVKGKRVSNKRDIDQRALYQDFEYLRSLTRQDPISQALYSSSRIGFLPVPDDDNYVSNLQEAVRFYSQRLYRIVEHPNFRIDLVIYDNEIMKQLEELDEDSLPRRAKNLLGNRGAPNYHLTHLNYTFTNAQPLAWRFTYGMLDDVDDEFVIVHSFFGIEESAYRYNSFINSGNGEPMVRYI